MIFRQFETFPVDNYYVNQSFQQNFENFSLVSIYSYHASHPTRTKLVDDKLRPP